MNTGLKNQVKSLGLFVDRNWLIWYIVETATVLQSIQYLGLYTCVYWLVVWNMNIIFPYIGNTNPN